MTSTLEGAVASGLSAFRVDGRVTWVTGGAQGIGLANACLLAEAGDLVVVADRDAAQRDLAVEGGYLAL